MTDLKDRPTVDGPLTAEELEDRDAGWDRQFKVTEFLGGRVEDCGNQYTGGQDF